jgi:hypothetical protein
MLTAQTNQVYLYCTPAQLRQLAADMEAKAAQARHGDSLTVLTVVGAGLELHLSADQTWVRVWQAARSAVRSGLA